MKTKDEIFNPKIERYVIGDPTSSIFVCGKNDQGELGLSVSNPMINVPSGLVNAYKYNAVDISTSQNHTGIVSDAGNLYLCGSSLHNKLGLQGVNTPYISQFTLFQNPDKYTNNFNVIKVKCGDYHTLCLLENGDVWAWGGTLHKKVGSGPSPTRLLNKIKIIKIACGDFHSAALSNNGVLFSWGGGGKHYNKGQTGHGIKEDIIEPMPIEAFKDVNIIDFDCGGFHTIAKVENEEFYAWGSGYFGELGNGKFGDSFEPITIKFPKWVDMSQIKNFKIECGGHHNLILIDNKLFVFGKGSYGQLGVKVKGNITEPLYLSYLSKINILVVKAGLNHSAIVTDIGDIFMTGYNKYGQLGLGDNDNRFKFEHLSELAGKKCNNIYLGGHHTIIKIKDNIDNYQLPSEFDTVSIDLNNTVTNLNTSEKNNKSFLNYLTRKSVITGDNFNLDLSDNYSIINDDSNNYDIEVIFTDNLFSNRFINIELSKTYNDKFLEEFQLYLEFIEQEDQDIVFYKIEEEAELFEKNNNEEILINKRNDSKINYTIMMINDLSKNISIDNFINNSTGSTNYDKYNITDIDIGKKIKYTTEMILSDERMKLLGKWHTIFEQRFKKYSKKINFLELRPNKYY